MSKIISLSKENFQKEVIESEIPVYVDFHTKGCGPCELIPPIMEQLMEEYGDKLRFAEYDVKLDDLIAKSDEVVEKYEVYGFPTIMLFKDGELKDTLLGVYEVEEHAKAVENIL